jgi:hypothetical protein
MQIRIGICAVVMLCLLAGVRGIKAQSVLVPAPQPVYSTVPTGMQQYATNQMQVFTPDDNAPPMGEELQPLKWGFITAHPHVYYGLVYGNGLESAPGQEQDSLVQTLSPGMLLNLGDYWTLDYTPTLTFYSNTNFQNTLSHSVVLNGGTTYKAWIFNFSQGYTRSSAPTVQTGTQTEQDNYSTALSATYEINSVLTLSLGANQDFNYIGNSSIITNSPSATRTWSTMDWLTYEFWPRLTGGVGAGTGYINEVGGSDTVYEQYQGQVNWRATDKISFVVSGGLQEDQFLGSGGSDNLVTPIFSASVQYKPFDQTRLTLSGSRTVSSSYYYVNQVTETTQVSADLNQRLLGFLYLDVGGSYSEENYEASESIIGSSRTDDYYSLNVSLTCPILKRGTATVFWSYSDNSSTQTEFLGPFASSSIFSYHSSQIGFSLSYQF